jgi:pyruvate formate lyase activating enzyme
MGSSVTASEVMAKVIRDRIFYEQSRGGVTFSGGEPTAQPDFLDELLTECGREGISTAIDTCGSAERDVLIGLAKKSDMVLYDLKGYDDARHVSYTGVAATPILENLDALAQIHKSIWIRLPIITGYTDDPNEMELLASRYSTYKSIKRVVLLPYHALGEAKLLKLGKNSKLAKISAPSQLSLDTLATVWKRYGFNTYMGAQQ